MKTPYSLANAHFSNKAHEIAREKVYPALFGVSRAQLVFDKDTLLADSERGRVLDGQMAVDRIVRVKVMKLRQPLAFTVQERFRRPKWAHKRDVTITEWNHSTNQPSELYKLEANLFVYGYFDEQTGAFIEVVAVNTAALLQAIAANTVPYTFGKNPRSNQSFLALTFDALASHGLLAYHLKPTVATEPQLKVVSNQAKNVAPLSFQVRTAQYTSTCQYCKRPIVKQVQKIAHVAPYGWIHAECAVTLQTAKAA